MDTKLRGLYNSVGGLKLADESVPGYADVGPIERFQSRSSSDGQGYGNLPQLQLCPTDYNAANSTCASQPGNTLEISDFSDEGLKYISDMLMEEDVEEKACMFQESSTALQAAEKALYDLIGVTYPVNSNSGARSHLNPQSVAENIEFNCGNCCPHSTSSFSDGNINCRTCHPDGCGSSSASSQIISQASYGSGDTSSTVVDGLADSPMSTQGTQEIFSDSDSVKQFKKGIEEGSKFIPNKSLLVDVGIGGLSFKDSSDHVATSELPKEGENILDGSRGKKNLYSEDVNGEAERSNKQSAVHTESTVSAADFDMVLLNRQSESALRTALQNEKSKDLQRQRQKEAQTKGGTRAKSQGRKKSNKNVVDLRTLLTLCAQAVAANDRRTANDYLNQIRKNSSPTGDGMQRIAYIFADGLEARLAGEGTQVYKTLLDKPTSAADVLKAYHLYVAACPFSKLSIFFSHQTIMNMSDNATTIHIVDFGILYGFQWPSLIQRLSTKPGGSPKIKITGIDLPNPGFRPAARVEETGRRLANYAKTFNVPFEFHAIAQKWDTIQLEDLKINRGEVLVVQCMYRLRNLLDETVVIDSPRGIVLQLIRKMNPDVFIQEEVNGGYSAPFFISRFREALFHYSTLFDMLETNVPREIPERMLFEKVIYGREAMNVIACEGAERIERPETYRQWQARTLRAGFRQLPLNREIARVAKERVTALYHKDFMVDEDGQWLLQGWKGRILYALSTWKPGG